MIWILLLAFILTAATVVIHALGTLEAIAHLAALAEETGPRTVDFGSSRWSGR